MKQIIVTGAAKGIGRQTTLRLLGEGHAVTAVDNDAASLEQLRSDARGELHVRCCDITRSAEVADLYAQLADAPLFGLVNNAGIYLGKGLHDYTDAEIERVLSVNLSGAIHMSKAFGEVMLRQRREGAIVNLGSSAMHGGSDPVYSTTKAGLVGLTKALAKTLAPLIRVNLVAPGIVDTGMFASLPADVITWYRNAELIKRPLVPDDVANTIAFLLSDGAKNYTGAVFDLNNGFHL
jgi:3-oxoacyl-[acyl-carrier protein] reductase